MADNVTTQSATPATIPASTVIAADDISSVYYQRIKAALGENGVYTADLAGVDLGSGKGAAFVRPRPDCQFQSQTSTGLTTASTNYSADDVVGALFTFTGMANVSGGGGWIHGAVLLDESDVISSYELWCFNQSVTFGTDNSGPSISDGDAALARARLTMSAARDLGGCRVAIFDSGSVRYQCNATSLYVGAQTLLAHNFFGATSALKLGLLYEPD